MIRSIFVNHEIFRIFTTLSFHYRSLKIKGAAIFLFYHSKKECSTNNRTFDREVGEIFSFPNKIKTRINK